MGIASAPVSRQSCGDLGVDRDTITEAWFVASAFPPATRRSGLPWTTYLILRFHPERHELVDRAASAGWSYGSISAAYVGANRPPLAFDVGVAMGSALGRAFGARCGRCPPCSVLGRLPLGVHWAGRQRGVGQHAEELGK